MKQSLLQKQILVDGKPACKLSQNVDTGLQQITFQGKQVSGPAHHYYMLNKPAGAVTANRDAEKIDCSGFAGQGGRERKSLLYRTAG